MTKALTNLPLIIGHRGACGHAPENTLASLKKAHELGVSWVEFDIMLAGCGEPIIMHDTRVDRTTDHQGDVSEFTYQQIAGFDAGAWFSEAYRGERVPTSKEFIHHLQERQMSAVVEIKPFPGQEKLTAEKTINLLQTANALNTPSIIVSSFSAASLETARSLAPEQHLGLAIDSWDTGWLAQVQKLSCASLHVDENILTQKHVSAVKAQQLYLFAYTVNEEARASELLDWGVDAIFSDFPDRLMPAVMKKKG